MKSFPLVNARAEILSKMPYFSVGLYGLVFVETPDVSTMGVTENLVLYYNPEFVAGLDHYHLVSILLHEILHVYGKTEKRFREAGLQKDNPWHKYGFNIAADLAINSLLRLQRGKIPGGVYPEQFGFPDNLTTEQYWNLLKHEEKETMEGSDSARVCAGMCGGAAGNAENPELEKELDKKYGKTEVEKEALQEAVAKEIQGASFGGSTWGSAKSEFEELIGLPSTRATLPWKRILQRKINKTLGNLISGGEYTSWSHPNKKSYASSIIRPGSVTPQAHVACIIDTSGSMEQEDLSKILAEIVAVLKATENDYVWLLQADVDVQVPPTPVNCNSLRNLKVKGRGGTYFDYALEAADKIKPRPSLVIYFTDGYAPRIGYKPKTDLLWVLSSSSAAPSGHECVRIS